jgi:hypothetical protein
VPTATSTPWQDIKRKLHSPFIHTGNRMFHLPPLLRFFLLTVGWFISHCCAVPYSEYILAPSSRTLFPAAIHSINGTVTGADSLIGSSAGSATFGENSSVTFDFGKNVGGFAAVSFAVNTTGCLNVTMTESSQWISALSSDATSNSGLDVPLTFCAQNANGSGTVSADSIHDRGSFRCIFSSLTSESPISI